MSKQIAIMKLLPSLEIAGCINELLRELQSRGDCILDYENCDMSLDHVEYHKAEDIDGEDFGRECTGFMISCTPDGFRIDMEVDTTIHFATYSNKGAQKEQGTY